MSSLPCTPGLKDAAILAAMAAAWAAAVAFEVGPEGCAAGAGAGADEEDGSSHLELRSAIVPSD